MVKEVMLTLSGSLHTNGGSWRRLQELQGLVQQRGEKEQGPPKNSWIELDQRCSRQEEQMGWRREEEMNMGGGMEKVEKWRGGSALPCNCTGRKAIFGYLALMSE